MTAARLRFWCRGPPTFPSFRTVHNGTQTSQVVTGTLNSAGDITYASPDILHTNGNGFAQVNGPFSQIQVLPTAAAFTIAAINWSLNINQGQGGTALPAFLNITAFPTVGGPDFDGHLALDRREQVQPVRQPRGTVQQRVLRTSPRTTRPWRTPIACVRSRSASLGVVINPQGGGDVPEPASWAMMILGFFRPGRCPAHPAAARDDGMISSGR